MTEPTVKRLTTAALALLLVLGAGCVRASAERDDAGEPTPSRQEIERMVAEQGLERATFAGGCFWCMEPPFEKLEGVHAVVSGYTAGPEVDPSYEEVSSGRTGHREAVVVLYDPEKIGYQKLLHVFWRQIDPTDAGGQFADRGSQYETGIFYHDQEQKRLAEESKRELAASGPFDEPLVTPILAAEDFYPAEEYHQDYYEKNPSHYKRYRKGSGREGFLERTWGEEKESMQTATTGKNFSSTSFEKPSDEELRQRLSDIQYKVTQQDGTERPFDNEYWDTKEEGIYVDVVSGEPLFSSKDKYKSGTGWPSFSRPLEPENITTKEDRKMLMKRTEVRSKHADSHLGHVFEDGPEPTGLRYCMNSASLRFIPADRLEEEGYGQYAHLFEDGD